MPEDKPKLLIIAFKGEGFADGVNMAELTAQKLEKLKNNHPQIEIKTLYVEADYQKTQALFQPDGAVRQYAPDYILGLGEKNESDENNITGLLDLYVETQALNIQSNDTITERRRSEQRTDIIFAQDKISTAERAPDTLRSAEKIFNIKEKGSIRAHFSENAGTGQCNQLFYLSLRYMKEQGKEQNASFFHLKDENAAQRLLGDPGEFIRRAQMLLERGDEIGLKENAAQKLYNILQKAEEKNWETLSEDQKYDFIASHIPTIHECAMEVNILPRDDWFKFSPPTNVQNMKYDMESNFYAAYINEQIGNIAAYLNAAPKTEQGLSPKN